MCIRDSLEEDPDGRDHQDHQERARPPFSDHSSERAERASHVSNRDLRVVLLLAHVRSLSSLGAAPDSAPVMAATTSSWLTPWTSNVATRPPSRSTTIRAAARGPGR